MAIGPTIPIVRGDDGSILICIGSGFTTTTVPVGSQAPVAIVAPTFTASGEPVGSTFTVNPGQWEPSGQVDTVTSIGYGLAGSFVAVIDGETGQSTVEMIGQEVTARVTANANATQTIVYIASGVTVADDAPTAPSDIAANLWTVTEITDEQPEGRRIISVNASVSVPGGWTLQAYSGTNSTTPSTGAVHQIIPGTPYTTSSGIAPDLTCYNALFWQETSSGIRQMAHPSNEVKSLVMVGVGPNTPPPGSGDLTPDETASTFAALRAIVVNWAGGGAPTGKTAADTRIVALTASISVDLDFSGIINDIDTQGWIIIRAQGTYTDRACSVVVNGRIQLVGSRGLHITRMDVRGRYNAAQAGSGFHISGGSDLKITRCIIWGTPTGTDTPTSTAMASWNSFTGFVRDGAQRITITDNLIQYGYIAQIKTSTNSDLRLERNVYGTTGNDVLKLDYCTDLVCRWHWGPRRWRASGSHSDHMQCQGPMIGALVEYCFFMMVFNSSWALGSTGPGFPIQAWFLGTGSAGSRDIAVRKCVFVNNNGTTKGSASNSSIVDCFMMTYDGINSGNTVDFSYNRLAYFGTVNSVVSGNVNGISYDVGDYAGPTKDLSSLNLHFETLPFHSNVNGTVKSTPGPISDLRPKTTSRLHWLHASALPVSEVFRHLFDVTYRREREVALGEIGIPGDGGWPTAQIWEELYNHDGGITTRFRTAFGSGAGSYDADGEIDP